MRNRGLFHRNSWVLALAAAFVLPVPEARSTNSVRVDSTLPFRSVPQMTANGFDEYRWTPIVQPMVDFWIDVYTKYHSQEGVIHDSKYINKIFERVDIKGLSSRAANRKINRAIKKWRILLRGIQRKLNTDQKMSSEELRIMDLYEGIEDRMKFSSASQRRRLRFQRGQSDHFKEAIRRSGRYLPTMEKIFKEENVPVELTRLPFVESSFNLNAYSKVGASGMWQFIRSTGRQFLIINRAIDERSDPYHATRSAARLLRQNYRSLKSWPLALIAYNHGRQGMMRAVRNIGTNRADQVISRYRSRTFGFASRNFLPSFLAAREVEANGEAFFGEEITRDMPDRFVEVGVPDFVEMKAILAYGELELEEFKRLNPSFTKAVYLGRKYIPSNYRIRIPLANHPAGTKIDPKRDALEELETRKRFWDYYQKIPAKFKHSKQRR